MSPGRRHPAATSSLISPSRPPVPTGLGSRNARRCRPSDGCAIRHSLFAACWRTAAHFGAPGLPALACEIKEEASAAGRRRGTFACEGGRTRRPPHRLHSESPFEKDILPAFQPSPRWCKAADRRHDVWGGHGGRASARTPRSRGTLGIRPGPAHACTGPGRGARQAIDALWIEPIAASSAALKSSSLCCAERPSVSARLKLATTPGFFASFALASSRL